MTNKLLSALFTGLLLGGAAAGAQSAPPAATNPVCHKLERDLSRLRSRMRQGYSSRQGERYRSRMWRLKTRYYKRCRHTHG